MRLLKFIGVFLAALLVVAAIIVIPSWKSIRTIFENKNDLSQGSEWVQRISSDRGLINFIQAEPKYVSVVSINPEQPDSSIFYQADTLRPLGTLSNLLLAIEYARQVEQGMLNPDTRIKISDIDRYNLPKVYSTYHTEAINELKHSGKIKDGTISIEELARITLQTNDLAASDYLYFLLGVNHVNAIPEQLHLKTIQAPLPWSGLEIAWKPSLYHQTVDQRFNDLKNMPAEKYRKLAINNAEKLVSDNNFFQKMQKSFEDNGLGMLFTKEKKFYNLTTKGTPRELATLLQKVVGDSLLSPAISRHVKNLLEQDVSGPMLKQLFTEYGGTFDSRMGLLNGADFGIAKRRPGTRIQVAFFDDLPVAVWFHMSSDFMNEDFQQKLIWNASLYGFAQKRLQGKTE